MINFRYHIVSLMAVFLALSVGIAVGVTLRPTVDEGLAQQAAQDRKQVQDLRTELERRDALDAYRDAYAARVGQVVTAGMLTGTRVAVVVMPDAPTAVVQSLSTAVKQSGGTVVRTVKVSKNAFDTTKATDLDKALSQWATELGLTDSMSMGTRFGTALGRVVAAKQPGNRDAVAVEVAKSLTGSGLITLDEDNTALADAIVVVTAEASDPAPTTDLLNAHIQMDVALRAASDATVLAGPNSDQIDGTDVLTARSDATAGDLLSTVDVADLPSGVVTVVLAAKEQLLGGDGGHYGALAKVDAPLPTLPLR